MGKVIICVGPLGTSAQWIKEYISKTNMPYAVCAANDYFNVEGQHTFEPSKLWMAHSKCLEKFLGALKRETPLIFIDNINARKSDRAKYINKALENGYEVELKVFPRDPELKRRIQFDIEPGTWKIENPEVKPYNFIQTLEARDFIRVNKI